MPVVNKALNSLRQHRALCLATNLSEGPNYVTFDPWGLQGGEAELSSLSSGQVGNSAPGRSPYGSRIT